MPGRIRSRIACAALCCAASLACTPAASVAPAGQATPSPSPAAAAAAASPSPGGRQRQLGSFMYQDHGTKDVRGQSELDLEADDYYFSPTFLQGTPGQKLRVNIENQGEEQHNLSITGQGVDMDVAPGGKAEVELTFPPSGALRFFCKYHATLGMNGQLLAGDATPQPVGAGSGAY